MIQPWLMHIMFTVTASPVKGGTVSGGNIYNEGTSVQVTAVANTGYSFTNWTENSTIVSTSADYTFTLGGADRDLVAHFNMISSGTGSDSGSGSYADPSSSSGTGSDSKAPQEVGGSGKSGWVAIQESIQGLIDNLSNQENSSGGSNDTDNKDDSLIKAVTVNMNGATVIPSSILKTIQGEDVTVTFVIAEGIEWVINGLDFPDSGDDSKLNDIDLAVMLDTGNIPEDVVNNLVGNQTGAIQMALAHEGSFGFTATLRINLGKDNTNGKYAYLYYYNPITKQLELQSIGLIDEDGNTQLNFQHASDYLILREDKVVLGSLMEEVTVKLSKKTIYTGGTTGLETTVNVLLPELIKDAVDNGSVSYKVSYSSSNPKIAAVSKAGTVKAIEAGSAVITTKVTIDGTEQTYSTKVIVKKASIKLQKKTTTMAKGSTFTFKAIVYGIDASKITWSTTKKSIVTINKTTGEATAASIGTDYVIAKCGNILVR